VCNTIVVVVCKVEVGLDDEDDEVDTLHLAFRVCFGMRCNTRRRFFLQKCGSCKSRERVKERYSESKKRERGRDSA